ncbi:unnamed protein product [Didymodactylos carnosus]|uniref:Reverse transcriptase domain-containing protein n=1 Tax=Didymodactylos carnosus TaxID=1234261 RepID=A0A814YGP6_9BILA|nr:unnamed protein product [Didymodactylos carnosus]CAF3991978.1 unnamed protein product [Didymodactylos carnosus]
MRSDQLWFVVNRFHGKRTNRELKHELKYRNKAAKFDQEKVDMFKTYFEEVYDNKPHNCIQYFDIDREIKQEIDRLTKIKTFTHPKITENELKKSILKLGNTAVGHDGVHNKCLKKYTKSLSHHLPALFNSSLKLGVIPPQWKLAHIILIQKPDKDPNDPTTYRPISLDKLMERLVEQMLNEFAEQHHLLPNYQAGFRQQRSTTDNLLHLKHDVDVNLYKNKQTALIVFDNKRAFDSVWFNGLLHKLKKMNVPEYLWIWICQFLSDRKALIEYKYTISTTFTMRRGTPQGSPLLPLLYILFTSDSLFTIPSHSNSNLFADDTALWSSANTTKSLSIRLQESVDEFVKWCRL